MAESSEVIKTLIDAVAAIGTAFAAIYAARAVRDSRVAVGIMQKQHEESIKDADEQSHDAIRTETFLRCLEIYLDIMTKQAQAIQEDKIAYAYDAQRALVDLLWFEFQLWQQKHVTDEAFEAWLDIRNRYYNEGNQPELKFAEGSTPEHMKRYKYVTNNTDAQSKMVIISYKRVWDYLVSSGYYPAGDKFVNFMSQIHVKDAKIMDIMRGNRKN